MARTPKRNYNEPAVFVPSKKPREDVSLIHSQKEKYISGTIKSIHLKDFMVHAKLDCEFGPRVNIITGVNGAGKSSVFQAIPLGLGNVKKETA